MPNVQHFPVVRLQSIILVYITTGKCSTFCGLLIREKCSFVINFRLIEHFICCFYKMWNTLKWLVRQKRRQYFHFTGRKMVYWINYIIFFSEYEIRKQFILLYEAPWLHAIVARRSRDPPFQAADRHVYFHVLLFVTANILQVYWITLIKLPCNYDITKQIYVVFLFLEAAHCCHASLERLP